MIRRDSLHTFERSQGLPIIPGILANADGVTVSYFKWTQNWGVGFGTFAALSVAMTPVAHIDTHAAYL